MDEIEIYIVHLYKRTSVLHHVNEAMKQLFIFGNRKIEKIPSTLYYMFMTWCSSFIFIESFNGYLLLPKHFRWTVWMLHFDTMTNLKENVYKCEKFVINAVWCLDFTIIRPFWKLLACYLECIRDTFSPWAGHAHRAPPRNLIHWYIFVQ